MECSPSDSYSHPCLRKDLILHGWQEAEQRYLIEDPRSGRAFMLKKTEFSILKMCDGVKAVRDITAAINLGRVSNIPEPSVAKFIGQLRASGVLEDPRFTRMPEDGKEIVPGGIEVHLERWATFLRPSASIFFSARWGGVVPCFLIAALHKSAPQEQVSLTEDIRSFLSPPTLWVTIILLYISLPITAMFHEIGHVLATFRFTGRLPVLLVEPVRLRFAAVTPPGAVWTMPSRLKRIAMALGGVYFDLLLLLSIVILRGRMRGHPRARHVCLSIVIPLAGSIVTNTLPCLPGLPGRRTDGYFAVSYLLAIPNLEARAREYESWKCQGDERERPVWWKELGTVRRWAVAGYARAGSWLGLVALLGGFCMGSRWILRSLPLRTSAAPLTILLFWLVSPYRSRAAQGLTHLMSRHTSRTRSLQSKIERR